MNSFAKPQVSATLHDVANAVGVTPGTVSRALNRPELVAEKTRKAILAAVRELHYVPNAAGRNLRSARTMIIGAVIPKTGLSTFAQSVFGLNDRLQQAGYTVVVAQPERSSEASMSAAYRLIERGADGLILLGEEQDTQLFELLAHRGLPYVLLWTVNQHLPGKTYVSVDQHYAGELVTKHLLELGHRNFAFVGSPTHTNPRAQARLLGVKHALLQANATLPENAIFEEAHRFGSGAAAIKKVLSSHPETTAIICTSDYHALGVLRALYETDIRVPEDISVVSFNNNDFSNFTMPSITTVDLKQTEVGERAGEMIIEMIKGRTVTSAMIKPELCIRESSGIVRVLAKS